MKLETVYKVTTKDLKSCAAVFKYFLPQLVVQYSVERFSLPATQDSGIFCFKDLDKVKYFFLKNPNHTNKWVVWEAEAFNVRKKETIIKVNSKFSLKFPSFWNVLKRFGFKRRPVEKYGFFICDGLKLKKMVDLVA